MRTSVDRVSKLFTAILAVAMVLAMTVSAFAWEAQPYNEENTDIKGSVTYAGQSYTVTVTAPVDTTKIEVDATLYQKTLLGRKEIDTMTGSVNSRKFVKNKSATIEKSKTYVIEVTADVYSGGVWDTVDATVTVKT